MNSNELKQIIKQIKKYKLENCFRDSDEFDEWVRGLNIKQVKNFISLNVAPNNILFPPKYLIDNNLLNCDDYVDRVIGMTKIKNAEGCYHLFSRLCVPDFLNSVNYYEDMEMLSRAHNVREPLWIIGEESFINSPYHREDLKLVVEAKDTLKDESKRRDWLVSEALAMVAEAEDSINSPYHQKDMQLIANSNSECLQSEYSHPDTCINKLAINRFSLIDKYHLENMQILAKCPISAEYLFKIMTDPEIIEGKYYRDEVKAMVAADSEIKALALYYYIKNPKRSSRFDIFDLINKFDFDCVDVSLLRRNNSIKGRYDSNYLKNLELLNHVSDKYVLFVESLLSNGLFSVSKHSEYDLEVLLSAENKEMFLDIYEYLSQIYSVYNINNPHHIKDLELIRGTRDIHKAMNIYSLDSVNHDYDMEYISKLDLEKYDSDIIKTIEFYLFDPKGINHPKHIQKLEKLAKTDEEELSKHLDFLENNPESFDYSAKEKNFILKKIEKVFKYR